MTCGAQQVNDDHSPGTGKRTSHCTDGEDTDKETLSTDRPVACADIRTIRTRRKPKHVVVHEEDIGNLTGIELRDTTQQSSRAVEYGKILTPKIKPPMDAITANMMSV